MGSSSMRSGHALLALAVAFTLVIAPRAAAQGLGAERRVQAGSTTLQVFVAGQGKGAVLLPSLGRGAEDFADLSKRLVAAGHRVILPQPRGIGASTGAMAELTLHDYANDIAAVIRGVSADAVTIVGHAWGNRLARMVATDHPDLVERLVLVAAGGRAPASPDIGQALDRAFDLSLPKPDHLAAVAKAFFAPGNDPAVWDGGWHPKTKQAQQAASRATPVDSWWAGGSVPILVLQGANDVTAPPANGELLLKEFGHRVTLVTVTGAGHALLPEQPAFIADTLIAWLKR